MTAPVLEVRDLCTVFSKGRAHDSVRAVDGVSFALHRGEVLGLVGESGCGKSTLARSILRLVPPASGSALLEGRDLLAMSHAELLAARPRIQMVFQDPHASLNPRMSVYDTLVEPLLVHRRCPRDQAGDRVARLLDLVGLARGHAGRYPHEFSGGQRQRIAIARALALEPAVLIADEPVSALDVSIQAQIVNLLSDLVRELSLGLIFISHDLAVVRHLANRVAVMYLGRIVEMGAAELVIGRPAHPYTRALLSAVPVPDPSAARAAERKPLQGDPPSPFAPPPGCAFHPRCPHAVAECRASRPRLEELDPGRTAACFRARELRA